MSWSRNQVQQLIDLYQKHPCLYAVKNKQYKNKHARAEALGTICMEICKIRPETTIVEIKNKFNNLRTNFLSQYRKYINGYHSGMARDEIYKPNIWYFEAMMFIVEHCTPRKSVDSINLPMSSPELPEETQFSISETEAEEMIDSMKGVPEFDVIETDFENQENAVGQNGNVKINKMHIFTPSTSISSRNAAVMTSSSGAKTKRKRAEYENELIETATSSLKEIKSALLSKENQPPAASTGSKKGSQSEVLGQFVAKQMSFIEECNGELFLDVQHQITEIIYNARKSCLT